MTKTTEELLDTLKSKRRIEDYFTENSSDLSFDSLSEMFEYYVKTKGTTKSEAIKKSGLDRTYGYQILSGEKKSPSRDKVIMMCFGLTLTLEETQHVLKKYTYGELYPRDHRDAVIIFSLYHQKSVMETNETLDSQGLKILE